jgi:hypothetical protein
MMDYLTRPRMAQGGRIGFFEAGLVKQGRNKGKARIVGFDNGKTAYFKDLETAKKAIAQRKEETSGFKKARKILNDPKLKKEFIEFGNQPGVSIKDMRKKFNISMEEFYEGGLRNLFDKDFQSQAAKKIKSKTVKNINTLLNDKQASNFLKKGQIVPDEILNRLNLLPGEAATATLRISQIYGGNDFGRDDFKKIKKSVKASDKLFEAMNKFQFGNPYRSKLYRASLELIDQQLGNEKGTFESLKKKASYILKKNKIKGFDINEIAGVTGTARTGVGEFSQFVDVLDSNLNQKQMASFQSAFSQARQNIINNPNVFAKESKRINKLAGIFEREYGVELPRIRALNEVEKFYSPTRLKQLSDQGLDIKAASQRLGYTVQMPKGAQTVQEFIKNPNLKKFLGSTQLNVKIPVIQEIMDVARSIPGDLAKKSYFKAAGKAAGLAIAPLVLYDTYKALEQGKPLLESLEQGIIGTNLIGGTKDILSLNPEERMARSVVKQDVLKDLNLDMPMGFGFIEGPTPQTNMTLPEAQQKMDAGIQRVQQERAQRESDVAANRANFFGNLKNRVLDIGGIGQDYQLELAGGGIAKLAGVSSGPPPSSGPNSQGLQGLMKRVKKL